MQRERPGNQLSRGAPLETLDQTNQTPNLGLFSQAHTMQTRLTLLVSLFLPLALALPNAASHISVGSIFELSHDSGRFIREAGDGDEPDTSTEQCPEAKYEAFFERYDDCMNAAQSLIDEVGNFSYILSGNLIICVRNILKIGLKLISGAAG